MSFTTRQLLRTPRFHVEQVTDTSAPEAPIQREIIRHPGAVVILPLVGDDRVCLIRNYRLSVQRTLLELPAGTREPNEPPEETARRELLEETGYRAERWEHLHTFYTAPGILDERMDLYVAWELTEGRAEREAGERIENHVVAWDEALRLVADKAIEDAKTIVGLLLYDRIRRGLS